ncbi:MAG: TPM domain-containing protein [Candidatus Peribacteraceae bacterium]
MRLPFTLFLGTILCLIGAGTVHAFPIPANDGFVTDAAGVLSDEEDRELERILTEYRSTTSNEIAIVMVPTLSGAVIEDVGLEIGRAWGVGSIKDNGILILASYQDRAVRIDVGYGLEGAVPDVVAKGIIDTDIIPAFREAKYAVGLTNAVTSLQKHIGGEYTAERYQSEPSGAALSILVYFVVMFLEWVLAIMARTKSWWLGGIFGAVGGVAVYMIADWWVTIPILICVGLAMDFLVSRAYAQHGRRSPWWAGGSWGPGTGGRFGGAGGGGFGGFGGGGFGGGGASGKW